MAEKRLLTRAPTEEDKVAIVALIGLGYSNARILKTAGAAITELTSGDVECLRKHGPSFPTSLFAAQKKKRQSRAQ